MHAKGESGFSFHCVLIPKCYMEVKYRQCALLGEVKSEEDVEKSCASTMHAVCKEGFIKDHWMKVSLVSLHPSFSIFSFSFYCIGTPE